MKHLRIFITLASVCSWLYISGCPTHFGQQLLNDEQPFFKQKLNDTQENEMLKNLDLSEYDLDEDMEDE